MPFVIAVVVAAGLIALLDVRLEGHRSFPVKSRPWYLLSTARAVEIW